MAVNQKKMEELEEKLDNLQTHLKTWQNTTPASDKEEALKTKVVSELEREIDKIQNLILKNNNEKDSTNND